MALTARIAPLWLALIAAQAGCGVRERTEQCNALAETVTAGVRPIQALLADDPRLTQGDATAARYRELTALYEQLSVDVGELELGDETLSDIQAGYRTLYQETATTCRQLADLRSTVEATEAATAAPPIDFPTATPSGVAAAPSGVAAAPSGVAATPSGVAATPSGVAAAPSGSGVASMFAERGRAVLKAGAAQLSARPSSVNAQANQLTRLVRRQDGLVSRTKLHCQQH